MSVRDFTDPSTVDAVLLVKARETKTKKNGESYLRLEVGDRTGMVPVNVWQHSPAVLAITEPGSVVRVRGRYSVHKNYGPQIDLSKLEAVDPASVDVSELLGEAAKSVTALEGELRALMTTVESPGLRALLDLILAPDSPAWPAYRDAPAAMRNHHAYRHGLLEHSLLVAQAAWAVSTVFAEVNRDLVVTGALLHDIGKVETYTSDPANIDMTDRGRLFGEIPLGYYRLRRLAEDLPALTDHERDALLHIVLSHHGALEHGSPVIPCTREATLVHYLDQIGGRFGAFDRLAQSLPPGEAWSAFDRMLSGRVYFVPMESVTDSKPEPAVEPAAVGQGSLPI